MINPRRKKILGVLIFCIGLALGGPSVLAQGKKALTFEDMMKFKAIQNSVVSENGMWVAYTAQPDRGDGEARVHSVGTDRAFVIDRGSRPVFSKDGRFVACVVRPKAIDMEKPAKDRPKQGLALLNLETGRATEVANVEKFEFSGDGAWLVYQLFKEEKKEEKKEEGKDQKAAEEVKKPMTLETGTELVLRNLATEKATRIPFVTGFAFDEEAKYLAYAIAEPEGKANGLFRRTLGFADLPEAAVHQAEKAGYRNLSWSKANTCLAFLAGTQDDKGAMAACSLWTWDAKTMKAVEAVSAPSAASGGLIIPAKNTLSWTKDGKRLFFGFGPKVEVESAETAKKDSGPTEADLFDRDKILAKREVDVWHWNDPQVNSQQKIVWNRMKDRTFTAVYHLGTSRMVSLAGEDMPDVAVDDNPKIVLGFSGVPYLKEVTWDGNFQDVYAVSLADGSRTRILERFSGRPSLSPNGNCVAYYEACDWHLLDLRTGKRTNLTGNLGVPFADEDHDTPDEPRGYGTAGWLADESAVLVYDKFDIWQFEVPSGKGMNLTAGFGRENRLEFRVLRTDPEARAFSKGQALHLSSYSDAKKNHGFYAAKIGSPGVEKKIEGPKKFDFVAKAKSADVLVYTRESYDEFPDLWAAGPAFSAPRKITDLNPQIKDFAWGSAELVEWTSADGVPLQGVLIKPGGYEPGKRYPVIIYFYELFSQRLHEFNQIVVNHRPCFPFYASNGYAVFLPDVRFAVGRPGPSSLKCVVPGAQKLVDMGVADPERIGIHGHSWSGYETAYIVTQTDFFACGIAGAAVGNMTSAYSGIRWESGLARQFQYEKTQSRIGGSLWEKPELYWENSPVFFADRVNTPLLLMHGDEDGAVPWYQSIEIYLAMRRLGKDCVFLQYRGEPHHPQKYGNKLDYSIKMKEYFDHYLKGLPAADWISKGVPYNGK